MRFNYTDRLEDEILALRPSSPPGGVFQYRSGDNATLGLALERALQGSASAAPSLTDYFSARLWDRIGAETAGVWSTDREGGLERTWCCLATSPRDLARLGQLVLDDGDWNGDRVISAEWIERSTTGRVLGQNQLPDWFRESPIETYAYRWWVASTDHGDILAVGKDGQILYVDRAPVPWWSAWGGATGDGQLAVDRRGFADSASSPRPPASPSRLPRRGHVTAAA